MIGSGLFISAEDYPGLDPTLRAGLEDWLAGKGKRSSASDTPPTEVPGGAPEDGGKEDVPSDLSLAQAKRLLEGCSDKTKAALRAVFSKDQPIFSLSDLSKELKEDRLGAVWAGITKRTRTVLGDKAASLFAWEKDEKKNEWVGSSSKTTFHSMRKALGIE